LECEACSDLSDDDIVDSVVLCAIVPDCGKYICQGDSGGSVLDQEDTQVGVVSRGELSRRLHILFRQVPSTVSIDTPE
jgi:hypothetical protein